MAGVETGAIWEQSRRSRAQRVRRVCERLESAFGRPRLGNPADPLDDLVFIIISNKTAPVVAERTYQRVKTRFPTWDAVLSARPSVLRRLLNPAGLSNVKASQLRAALGQIRSSLGTCDLEPLNRMSVESAETFLVSLPGVSEKVAKCVMMYALGAAVLPVDGHVHRISSRLGWTARRRLDQCHAELEALVPAIRRFAFHVDCIALGRSVCRPQKPLCGQCPIASHCAYAASRN